MNVLSPKRASTLFLKFVLIIIAIATTVACGFAFVSMWNETLEWPINATILYSGLFGIYLTLLPFLFALFQAFTLLQYIDKNNAFSELSIEALRKIGYCAIAMTVLYACAMPLAYVFAELDDAPGVIIISGAIVCAPLVIATFAAVLQKLVRNALDMKEENDFTI